MSEQQSNRMNRAAIRCIPEPIGEPEGPKVTEMHQMQPSVILVRSTGGPHDSRSCHQPNCV